MPLETSTELVSRFYLFTELSIFVILYFHDPEKPLGLTGRCSALHLFGMHPLGEQAQAIHGSQQCLFRPVRSSFPLRLRFCEPGEKNAEQTSAR